MLITLAVISSARCTFTGLSSQVYSVASCSYSALGLTDEAEDVPDGGDEDDQHVVEGQDCSGDQHVASPAELAPAEQQRGDGGADLLKHKD